MARFAPTVARALCVSCGIAAAMLGCSARAVDEPSALEVDESMPGVFAMAAPDFREIVQRAKERVFPAVVYIRVVSESNASGKKEGQIASGSGVIVSEQGHVLTNWHVVDKATNVRCQLSDGRHGFAKVLGSDKDTDLAVLQLQFQPGATPFAVAQLAASAHPLEGDFVMAMGAPWGLNRSVSIGIVSCAKRYLPGASEYSHWIQTDAAINPGNSGGPLVNTLGEVVGLNARGMILADGMGFAIPAETMQLLYLRLRDTGAMTWAWTGLQLQPLHDFDRDSDFDDADGVIVAGIDPDSPAASAGFRVRDRIVAVDGRPVMAAQQEDLSAVKRQLGLLPVGNEARFEVVRDDITQTIALTPREKGRVDGEELALSRFDLSLKVINQFANPDLHFHRAQGVFVFAVKRPGNAADAGLVANDILLRIDGREVASLADADAIHADLIAHVDTKSRALVEVLRRGLLHQVVLDFARDYERK